MDEPQPPHLVSAGPLAHFRCQAQAQRERATSRSACATSLAETAIPRPFPRRWRLRALAGPAVVMATLLCAFIGLVVRRSLFVEARVTLVFSQVDDSPMGHHLGDLEGSGMGEQSALGAGVHVAGSASSGAATESLAFQEGVGGVPQLPGKPSPPVQHLVPGLRREAAHPWVMQAIGVLGPVCTCIVADLEISMVPGMRRMARRMMDPGAQTTHTVAKSKVRLLCRFPCSECCVPCSWSPQPDRASSGMAGRRWSSAF